MHGYTSDANGLMRLGHRYYDASTGRFISRDPIWAGYNWYAYCGNDPVNAVDPTGLIAGVDDLALLLVGVAIITVVVAVDYARKNPVQLPTINFSQPDDDLESEDDMDESSEFQHRERERRKQRGDNKASNQADRYLPPRGTDQRRGAHDDLDNGEGNTNNTEQDLKDTGQDWINRGRKWKRDNKQ